MSAADGLDRTPSERVDVCVVGAGPAGALCAHSLAERGHDVVVLEAGREFDFGRRGDQMEATIRPDRPEGAVWDVGGPRDAFVSSGDVDYPLNRTRVKGIGGTSLHWAGRVARLHEKDFEMDSRYGLASDWPIDYADLKPYYAAAEREIGVAGGGDNPFAPPRDVDLPMPPFPPSHSDEILGDAAADLDVTTHPVNRAQASEAYDGRSACVGYGVCQTCPSGAKYTAEIHVEKAIAAGARVLDRVPVQSLEHDDSGEVVEAAVYEAPDGRTYRQAARQFVLAAGAVEIPRLLLLSRSEEHPDGLANASGTVGRYFMEHPAVVVVGRVDEPTRQHAIGFSTRETHQFYDHDDPTPGSFVLGFKNNAGPDPVNTAVRGGDVDPREDVLSPVFGDEWGDDLLGTLRSETGGYLEIVVTPEQLPAASNRVTIDPSRTDDRGNPVPDVSYAVGDHLVETLADGADVARRILETAGAEIVSVTDPEGPNPAAHHMGTTRMGTDPAESVVSPRLRTHDLDNCWIASGSTFVTGGAMPPTLTIAALALKAASHVDEEL